MKCALSSRWVKVESRVEGNFVTYFIVVVRAKNRVDVIYGNPQSGGGRYMTFYACFFCGQRIVLM